MMGRAGGHVVFSWKYMNKKPTDAQSKHANFIHKGPDSATHTNTTQRQILTQLCYLRQKLNKYKNTTNKRQQFILLKYKIY